ncbi:MAG: DUF262 domain-containing protein [Nitrospirae bacterium]|uniref:DUF262 domain-containing protein n=1 Tax=Candidatus Magnetobacterium casense TaxID=1455061 RepID=UPI00058BC5DF|nr:DUF262 domain-containing protein [Candidatus Magnetobacterium casensis]MBF0336866.1 DUF262 domain-containing protein [Nitrospirota bacterium]
MEQRRYDEEPTADGRPSGVEAEEEIRSQEPFDPERISIDVKNVAMDVILRRLLQDSIRLATSFQRKAVWDITRKSQLIESLMLKIPLPMFYVSSDEKGYWDVVDGLQRLTTIKEFVLGNQFMETRNEEDRGKGLQLVDLEFWGAEYDKVTFKELPELIKNRILETEFRFTIIHPGTPEAVKRNIFKRINTGGMPLTSQEIKHALYQGKSTRLLEELVETEEFKKATANSVDDSRMAARELVLRFLAFSVRSYESYPKTSDMDTFLSDTMRLTNIMPELEEKEFKKIFKDYSKQQEHLSEIRIKDIDTLKKRFFEGMKRACELFGEYAFRKSFSDDNRRSPINKTLFEVWGNLLADLDKDSYESLLRNKASFLNDYNVLLNDQKFERTISRYSSQSAKVRDRYIDLGKIIDKYAKQEGERT